MRELKFRAWLNGSMYYNHSVSLSIGGQVFYLQTSADWEEDTEGAVKLMQYTGMKDKNGREVYESDILKGKEGGLLIVAWVDNGWYLTREKHAALYFNASEYEIAGNIYE